MLAAARNLKLRTLKFLPLIAVAMAVLFPGMTGSATAATALTISPGSFDLGAKNSGGEASFPGEFTITNDSGDEVNVSRPQIQPLTNFLIPSSWDGCFREVLEPGESCFVAVMFEPEEEGRVNAELVINSSAPGPAASAALTGFAYPRLLPAARANPASADFGSVGLDTTSAARTIEFVNDGLGDLIVEAAAIGGRNATEFRIEEDRCRNRHLASGMSCGIDVVFNPKTAGISEATLILPTNDTGADTFIELSGTGAGIDPGPKDGRARVRIGSKPLKIKERRLKIPINCRTSDMETCAGRIRVFVAGKSSPVARGVFSVPAGNWFATLYAKPMLVRSVKPAGVVKARFEVTTTQESGENLNRTFKRNIRS